MVHNRLSFLYAGFSILLVTLSLQFGNALFAQDYVDRGTLQGNVYSEVNYYIEDSLIGAPKVPEYIRSNVYGNIFYRYKGFNAGVRYEAYQPPLLGFDDEYRGMGIAHRFASYADENYEVTIGNFYEQFGSGMVLRAYEDKYLGIDNAFDGFKLVARPVGGLEIKGMVGKQRFYWDHGPGTVRGMDAEWNILQSINPESSTSIVVGVSAVSRYQSPNHPKYFLPGNVAAFAGRMSFYSAAFTFSGEYAWKVNDPSSTNGMIYKNGQALNLSGSYSQKGLGVLIAAKYVDNMDFRSSRSATGNSLTLSYLPAISHQHTYSFSGMYPYATQPNGEVGAKAQVNYTIPRGSKVGGKYGTTVTLNASIANSIGKEKINDTTEIGTEGTKGYYARLGSIGDEKYYQDLSLEVTRKFTSNLKGVAGFANQFYNKSVIEGHPGEESVKAWVVYTDFSYRFLENRNIRVEFQHLSTQQDKGNWAMALVEYSVAPSWTFSISDQFNYGNSEKDKRKHYYSFQTGYSKGSYRLSVSYGKQRDGIICVGGVCRRVPASYSAGLVFSTTF